MPMHILFFVEKTYIHPPPLFGLRSSPFYSGYSPQPFFLPSFRSKIYCFTQVCFRKGCAASPSISNSILMEGFVS